MGNYTYIDRIVNQKPFGWNYTDPQTVYHFHFEEIDPYWWHSAATKHPLLPFYVGTVYLILIFGIKRFLRDRDAFDLRMPLFWWNASLGFFSSLAFIRFLPGFLYVLQQPHGLYNSICVKRDINIPMGFWLLAFVLSKFVELGDTLFIVLRKRPLVFLQWYHHLITMVVVWKLAPFMEPITRWYAVLNYGVHSLMYPYFAAKALEIKVAGWFAKTITTLQLVQMIVGFCVNFISMYFQQAGYSDCYRHPSSIKFSGFLYGSFIILFGKLFYDAVIKSKKTWKPVNTDKKHE